MFLLLTLFIDSAIRVAARWYQSHLGGSIQVLLITNDKENKRKAIEEGLSAETGTLFFTRENQHLVDKTFAIFLGV